MDIKELLAKCEDIESKISEDDELGLFIQTTGSLYDKYIAPAIQGKGKVAWDRLVREGARLYKREIDATAKFGEKEFASAKEYLQNYFKDELNESVNETTPVNTHVYSEYRVFANTFDNGEQKFIGKNRDFKSLKQANDFFNELVDGGYINVTLYGWDKNEPKECVHPIKELKDGKILYDETDIIKTEDFKSAEMKKAEYKDMKIEKPEVEKAPKLNEEVAEKLNFKLGDADVEVTNDTKTEFTADEIKEVIEKENPRIFFNNADSYHYIMDFSFEKNGKKYWIESKNIEGDFSKFELNIYESFNESVAGSLVKELTLFESKEVRTMIEGSEEKPAEMEKAEYDEVKPIKPEVDENGKKAEKELKEGVEDKTVNFMNKPLHYEVFNKRSDGGFVTLEVGKGELKDNDEDCYILVGYSANTNQFRFTVIYEDSEKNCDIMDSFLKDDISKADLENLKNAIYDEYNVNEDLDDEKEPTKVTVKVSNVEWDTDDEEVDLPKEFTLTVDHYEDTDLDDEVSDAISDEYGFCHFGFNYIVDGQGVSESRADKIRKGIHKRVKHESLTKDEYQVIVRNVYGENAIIKNASNLANAKKIRDDLKSRLKSSPIYILKDGKIIDESLNEATEADINRMIEKVYGKVGNKKDEYFLQGTTIYQRMEDNGGVKRILDASTKGKLYDLLCELKAYKNFLIDAGKMAESLNEEGAGDFKYQIGDMIKMTRKAQAEGRRLFGADFKTIKGEVINRFNGGIDMPNVYTVKMADGSEETVAETLVEYWGTKRKKEPVGESNIETLNKVHNIRKTNARNAEIAFRNADDELTAKKMAVYQKNYFDPKKSEKEIAELNAKYDGEIEQLAKEKAVADAKLANNKKLMANRKVESFASLNAKLESHLNEEVSNWERDVYLPGTVKGIKLVMPIKYPFTFEDGTVEDIDHQLVAYIYENKPQFSHKFGYELVLENGGDSEQVSTGDSDYLDEIIDLCVTAIKEFDKEHDTYIIYDVRPLEPSAEDIKYLNGEKLKEDANLKPSIAYDDREGKYVCFATENGGAVKYTDTKEDAEQFLIDKYGIKKEDIKLIESKNDELKTAFTGDILSLKDGSTCTVLSTEYSKDRDVKRFKVRLEDGTEKYISRSEVSGLIKDHFEDYFVNESVESKTVNEEEKTYYLYAGYYELYLTDHKLTPPYMYQAENTDLNQLINDNISEIDDEGEWTNPDAAFSTDSATICFDKNIIDELNKTDLFGGEIDMYYDALSDAEFNGEDEDKVKEDYHIYDLSKYYADKNESLNEISLESAKAVNDKRQFNSLKADLKANMTNSEDDREEANKLADKSTKSNKLLQRWKKAKGIEESAQVIVATFDEGLHEIVKCDKGYFNRYNIKDGKARFTTKCVESLPTAVGALKRRFPNASEDINVNESLNEEFKNFKGYKFKGIVNSKTGEIIYSKLSPKGRVLQADIKMNVNDKEDFNNKEIIQAAKKVITEE